jgi:hypothetical protein
MRSLNVISALLIVSAISATGVACLMSPATERSSDTLSTVPQRLSQMESDEIKDAYALLQSGERISAIGDKDKDEVNLYDEYVKFHQDALGRSASPTR